MTTSMPRLLIVALVAGFSMMAARAFTVSEQSPAGLVQIDEDDIGGVVTGARGPKRASG